MSDGSCGQRKMYNGRLPRRSHLDQMGGAGAFGLDLLVVLSPQQSSRNTLDAVERGGLVGCTTPWLSLF